MNKAQYERLSQFFHGLSSRSRVLLYLLAIGMSSRSIVNMKITELEALTNVPADIRELITLIRDDCDVDGLAFVYPNKRKYVPGQLVHILKRACENAGYPAMGLDGFRVYVTDGKETVIK